MLFVIVLLTYIPRSVTYCEMPTTIIMLCLYGSLTIPKQILIPLLSHWVLH